MSYNRNYNNRMLQTRRRRTLQRMRCDEIIEDVITKLDRGEIAMIPVIDPRDGKKKNVGFFPKKREHILPNISKTLLTKK